MVVAVYASVAAAATIILLLLLYLILLLLLLLLYDIFLGDQSFEVLDFINTLYA